MTYDRCFPVGIDGNGRRFATQIKGSIAIEAIRNLVEASHKGGISLSVTLLATNDDPCRNVDRMIKPM
jgi:hypothetical protein